MNEEEEKKTASKDENIVRITVTKDADIETETIVGQVNDGFDGGRVTKQDVSSWILLNFRSMVGLECVDKIRSEFFNELVRFKNLLKLAQQSGGLTPDIRKALRDLSEDAAKPKRKKLPLKNGHIIDMVGNKDAA